MPKLPRVPPTIARYCTLARHQQAMTPEFKVIAFRSAPCGLMRLNTRC